MKIITAPHPSLRQIAKPIEKLDKKLIKQLKQVGETLQKTKKPQGVGLAAPQTNIGRRFFFTWLEPKTGAPLQLRHFINPKIIDQSSRQIFGTSAADKENREEGCLSIPGIYGPIPRAESVKVTYLVLENNQLVEKTEVLTNFAARVFQHELDHLDGILFIDYSLRLDLPLYQEVAPDKYEEIDKRIVEAF